MTTHAIQSLFTGNTAHISKTLPADIYASSAETFLSDARENWLTRKYRVSISCRLIDKIEPNNKEDYAKGFVSHTLTIGELANQIKNGFAYGSHYHNAYRNSDNFQAADIVSVDIDEGMTIDEALSHPLVQRAATLVYTTASHQPDAHRFRIVFALPRTITDPIEFRSVMRSLALRLNGDGSTVDPARMFYGNRNAEIFSLGRGIDDQLLAELIEQSVTNTRSKTGQTQTVISQLRIPPDLQIQAANGFIGLLPDFKRKDNIHCPFHNDRKPSAFITQSIDGNLGIHCNTCVATFWPDDQYYDFYSFEQEAEKAASLIPVRPAEQTVYDLNQLGFAHSEVHLFDRKFIGDLPLIGGISLVRSPKGSGKTTFLKGLTARNPHRILLIGHRQSLICKMCDELGLHCYLDDELEEFKYTSKNKRQSRYGICVDSLAKIDRSLPYDYILIDESEQVLTHFRSDTLGQKRHTVFQNFIHLLGQARNVIALDADLSWTTFNSITKWARSRDPKKRCNIFINKHHAKRGTLKVIASKNQIIGEILQAIEADKTIFVTSNSRNQIKKLEAAIRAKRPGVKLLAITAETVSDDNSGSVRDFIADPIVEAKKYQVVLASPSLGTGIDINFDHDETYFDIVFGIFMPDIISHFDCDQQLARVRHPGEVRVYVSPRQFNYETNMDVTRRDILETMMSERLLISYNDHGQPIYNEDDPLLSLVAAVVSRDRASINRLKHNFIDYKIREGWEIQYSDDTDEAAIIGIELAALGKRLVQEQLIDRLLQASPLSDEEFKSVRKRLDGQQYVPDQQRANYWRSSIERFYCQPLTRELIMFDDEGRGRRQALLFKSATDKTLDRIRAMVLQETDETAVRRPNLIYHRDTAERVYLEILRTLPIYRDGEFLLDHHFTLSDLGPFIAYLEQNKSEVEAQLKTEVRRDLHENPTRMAGNFIRMAGLSFASDRKKTKDGGRRYRLDAVSYNRMISICGLIPDQE